MDEKVRKVIELAEGHFNEEEMINFKYYLLNRESPNVKKQIECNIELTYYIALLEERLNK